MYWTVYYNQLYHYTYSNKIKTISMIKYLSMIGDKQSTKNSIGQAVFSEKPVSQAPSGTLRCYEKWAQIGIHPTWFMNWELRYLSKFM